MSIRKTSEYRDAMKAHKACYSEDMSGQKLSTRMATIAKYHTHLEKLVSRMLKDEGIQSNDIDSDRDSINGHTYYAIDFGCARQPIHPLGFIDPFAARCGVEIPSFRFSGCFEFSVDMTPHDVCESLGYFFGVLLRDIRASHQPLSVLLE
jgi:hypothetical protein